MVRHIGSSQKVLHLPGQSFQTDKSDTDMHSTNILIIPSRQYVRMLVFMTVVHTSSGATGSTELM